MPAAIIALSYLGIRRFRENTRRVKPTRRVRLKPGDFISISSLRDVVFAPVVPIACMGITGLELLFA